MDNINKKSLVLEDIFKECQRNKRSIFHNQLVKRYSAKHKFSNPFDATKLDSSDKLPNILKDKDYFIIHLGEGNHCFVKGIDKGFHKFEDIKQEDIQDWEYKKSLLNEFDTSESNILSIGSNEKIIHDFLYEDRFASPKVYNARRTKVTFSYYVGKEYIQAKNLQIEIDQTMELNGVVTIFEGKNGFPSDFAVYQLFFPFSYYQKLKEEKKLGIEKVLCCYLLRKKEKGNSIIRMYNYTFTKKDDMTSIQLLKSKQYCLIKK